MIGQISEDGAWMWDGTNWIPNQPNENTDQVSTPPVENTVGNEVVFDPRQQYIPVSRAKVKQALFNLDGIDDDMRGGLAKVSEMLEAIWHHSSHDGLEELKSLY